MIKPRGRRKCRLFLVGAVICISLTESLLRNIPPLKAAPPSTPEASQNRTFCNPINLPYRFQVGAVSRREAADPVIERHGDDFYLFASKSGGYWYSADFKEWQFVRPVGLPLESYAPTVLTVGGRMLFIANGTALYATDDPKRGLWKQIADPGKYSDPALFRDDDGRIYLYSGLSLNGAISGVELDQTTFLPKGESVTCFRADVEERGWERSGEDNQGVWRGGAWRLGPFIEGSWMTKHNGVYYLQYAAPGTIWKSYADGIFTSRSPLGPFTYAPNSPFSYKPGGFVGGAGHGSTFRDKKGQYWRIVTAIISVKEDFERRLVVFPAFFDADGVFHTDTYLGDYPQRLPGEKGTGGKGYRTGWMLLSGEKPAKASSSLDGHPVGKASDEDIGTHWSAETGDHGEWLTVDLKQECLLRAVQVNFAEQNTTANAETTGLSHQYLLEVSADGNDWSVLADHSGSMRDTPHDYIELSRAVPGRFVRITNRKMPGGGKFAVRGLRVFGNAGGQPPPAASGVTVLRGTPDSRSVTVSWEPVSGADRFIVRYGIDPDKLYNSYEVLGGGSTSVTFHSLNRSTDYFFTVDSVNGSGVSPGTAIIAAPAHRP